MTKGDHISDLYEVPTYGIPEAALYLRVPYQTLRYWLTGFNRRAPIVRLASDNPPRLSFFNLLECHVLVGMRRNYDLKLPKVRRALVHLDRHFQSRHPLIDRTFFTDRTDLFIKEFNSLINVSRSGQTTLNFLEMHLQRVEQEQGLIRFFPFVMERRSDEPKSIEINPGVGFGKPVIAGTGISTAVIISRFNARDSVESLASEYGCDPGQIEEAIRWERAVPIAA